MNERTDNAARHAALGVALALFAWFAATAWMRPLILPDEGRYAGVAWEMLRSGNWSVPTLDGMPFFHKPPLFYWLAAAAMELLGANVWAARVPSLIGATLAGWALYLFARRWGDGTQARGSAMVLATQPFFCLGAQFANLDMLVAGCISATVLLGAHSVMLAAERSKHRLPLMGAYAFAALGLLAKGLIGPVLPAGIFIAWLLVTRRPRLIWALVSAPGLAVFVVVGAPWFLAMQQHYPGFNDYFFVYQHFQRFAEAGFNNVHAFWFYLPVIVGLTLPWSLALPAALRRREVPGQRPSVTALMWCWFAVVLVFFSFPKSKLIGYVLPALPPLAWLLARALAGSATLPSRLAGRAGTLAVIAAALCVAAVTLVASAYTTRLPALSIIKVNSNRLIGLALRDQRTLGDPVIFVHRYAYDVPFYARLEAPPVVLDAWTNPEIPQHDDWRKELFDAGLFDPAAASTHLIGHDALMPLLCAHSTAWIVATADEQKAEPLFASATQIESAKDASLWKLVRSPSLKCETPNAGSPGR